mgnify:FL=1
MIPSHFAWDQCTVPQILYKLVRKGNYFYSIRLDIHVLFISMLITWPALHSHLIKGK